jgi:hypothetical protein
LVRNRLLDGILSGDVRDVHGDIIDTTGKPFSFRPLSAPFYLCFLAGAGFFAGWDFFTGSGFFCTLTGALTAVFLLGTLCFTAAFATGPRTTLAGTDFDGTDLAAVALAGTGFIGSAFFAAGECG